MIIEPLIALFRKLIFFVITLDKIEFEPDWKRIKEVFGLFLHNQAFLLHYEGIVEKLSQDLIAF